MFGADVRRRPFAPVGRDAANARVCLVAFAGAAKISTRDASDRAHNMRDADGLLVPGSRVIGATPRRYPRHQMAGTVANDSSFDGLYERQRRLDREFGEVAGVSYAAGGGVNGGSVVAEACDRGGVAAARQNRRSW